MQNDLGSSIDGGIATNGALRNVFVEMIGDFCKKRAEESIFICCFSM